ELLPGLLDAAEGDAEGRGDPGGLDAAPVEADPALEVEAAEEVSQDGGDHRGPGAAGQKPEDATGYRHQPAVVGNLVEEVAEAGAVGEGDGSGRCREFEGRIRPAQEPRRREA